MPAISAKHFSMITNNIQFVWFHLNLDYRCQSKHSFWKIESLKNIDAHIFDVWVLNNHKSIIMIFSKTSFWFLIPSDQLGCMKVWLSAKQAFQLMQTSWMYYLLGLQKLIKWYLTKTISFCHKQPIFKFILYLQTADFVWKNLNLVYFSDTRQLSIQSFRHYIHGKRNQKYFFLVPPGLYPRIVWNIC